LTISLGGDIVWSTQTYEHPVYEDTNHNRVGDYIEKNSASLRFETHPSHTAIRPAYTARVNALLRNDISAIDDDASSVHLRITRIDDLDTGVSYTRDVPDWAAIQDRYVKVVGSSILRDWQATWTLQTRPNIHARIVYDITIGDTSSTFVISKNNILRVEEPSLRFALISGTSLPAGSDFASFRLLSTTSIVPTSVDISITSDVTKKIVWQQTGVTVRDNIVRIQPPVWWFLNTTWSYTVTFTTSRGYGTTSFRVVPGSVDRLDVTTTKYALRGLSVPLTLTTKDLIGNTTTLDGWTLSVKSSHPFQTGW
jgi:hypothetical protein